MGAFFKFHFVAISTVPDRADIVVSEDFKFHFVAISTQENGVNVIPTISL